MRDLIERPLYIDKIRPFMHSPFIKVLTGMRRCGKSTLLKLLQKELLLEGVPPTHLLCYNFESARHLALLHGEDLYHDVIAKAQALQGKVYIFLDEIQNVSEWERYVTALRIDCDSDIYLTGSNSRLLSGELASLLTGRHVSFEVYPLSYTEFRTFYTHIYPDTHEPDLYQRYKHLGGLPEIFTLREPDTYASTVTQSVINDILIKDIVKRYSIRNLDLFERFFDYALSEIGTPLSATSLSKYLKNTLSLPAATIVSYLDHCCEAFLLAKVQRSHLKGKERLSSQVKYYPLDHSIAETRLNRCQDEKILENMVFVELKRRGYQVSCGLIRDREVDFVAIKQRQPIYLQVSLRLDDDSTREREFGVLKQISDNYPKFVISESASKWEDKGIQLLNIIDFLAGDSWERL